MSNLLSQEEYDKTFVPPMKNVSDSADEIVDLWGYADPIIESEYHNCTAWDWKVAHIYETDDGSYQHIGIPVPKDDTYLVIIVDTAQRDVVGHFILDLREKYSLHASNDT